MFDNCKSLKFVNLSNIDISSLINMDNGFRNCKSLKSIDLTNVDLSKIPYHKNIFHNCINLNNKVKDKSYEGKTNIKILNEQNKLIYNDKKRALIDGEKCDINNIFNQDRLCTIQALSNEEIIEQLRENDNRVNLINNILNNNDKISIINHNEIYSILKLDFGDDIRIKECETILKNKYNISKNSPIFIYLQETQKYGFTSEIKGEFFDSTHYLNKSFCEENITEYINEIDSPNNFYCNYAHNNLRQRLLNFKFNYNIKNKDISSYQNSKNFSKRFKHRKNEDNNECFIKLNNGSYANNNQVYDFIQGEILQSFNPEDGLDIFIEGLDNVIFQITTTENQKYLSNNTSLNPNKISTIDLGDCEDKLREENYINRSQSLIIIKYENVNRNIKPSEKNIQFDVFSPSKEKLDLSTCKDININIFIKKVLGKDTQNIYDITKEQGYDMFDINSKFYQDICTPYNSEGNYDVLLSDRKDHIFNNKDTKCQSNCFLFGYSVESKYVSCECNVNRDKSYTKIEKFKPKKFYEIFISVLKYSNYDVFKCYKLVFNKSAFITNLGSILILLYFLIYFICYIIFLIKGEKPLKKKLFNLIDITDNLKPNEDINIINPKSNQNKLSLPPKKKGSNNINIIPNSIYVGKQNSEVQKIKLKENISKINSNNISDNSLAYSKEKLDITFIFGKSEEFQIKNKIKVKNKELSDFELNELEYEKAVKLDKRNFFQIYFAALKREHIIIFTFFSCNDLNLIYIKIARFFVLVATDMAMNVFFFNDETMHKIFVNYGKYDFVQQIPQILYSTILSQILEIFLCYLSMTDKYIYKIKNSQPNSKQIMILFRCINYKLIIFFIFTFLLFCFYWYIVSSFCAVYENTQIIFIKDSLSSFLLGIIYSLFIYLIPSGFRLCSIKSVKMKYKWLYKLSDVIPFF